MAALVVLAMHPLFCGMAAGQALVEAEYNVLVVINRSSPVGGLNFDHCVGWDGDYPCQSACLECVGSGPGLTSVAALWLNSTEMSGEIPQQIAELPMLTRLELASNQLTGTVPWDALSNLTELDTIELQKNRLTGNVSSSVARLTKLVALSIYDNYIGGEVPWDAICSLTRLQVLSLGGNPLSGPVSPCIDALVDIRHLTLGCRDDCSQRFSEAKQLSDAHRDPMDVVTSNTTVDLDTGEVELPADTNTDLDVSAADQGFGYQVYPWDTICNLTSLEQLRLLGSSDGIPACVRGLNRLQHLLVAAGISGGEVPWDDICSLTELTNLELYKHGFTGEVSPCIANLTKLKKFSVNSNDFTGDFPWTGICAATEIKRVILFANHFTGELPRCIGNLSDMVVIGIDHNRFSGQIPWDALCGLPSLEYLYLGDNPSFTPGQLPKFLSQLSTLQRLDVHNAGITGELPWAAICSLDNLIQLEVQHNPGLNGSVSNRLGQMTKLTILHLGFTSLHGPMPWGALCNLTSMQRLHLGHSQFSSGLIDTCICNISGLQTLGLQGTNRIGSIPPCLGNMAHLKNVTLGENDLEGEVPATFCNLQNLTFLVLSANPHLVGSLPACMGNMTSLQRLDQASWAQRAHAYWPLQAAEIGVLVCFGSFV